jgi:CBS domain-containing protein
MSIGFDGQDISPSPYPHSRLLEFLRKAPPFEALDTEELKRLISRMELAFFPRGQRIVSKGDPPYKHLYLIQQGAARVSLVDEHGEELLVDERGETDYFGATSILQGKPPMFDITAQQDLIALMLPAEDLRQLAATHPEFQHYFSLSLARTIEAVRQSTVSQRSQLIGQGALNLDVFLGHKKVADLMSRQVLTCTPEVSARTAASLMTQQRVSSIVVTGNDLSLQGIVTDNDLRSKVLAAGLDPEAPVDEIMSRPVRAIAPDAYAFDALLSMSHYGVRLLLVVDDNRLVGIISEHDLQMETGSSPVQIIGAIERSTSLSSLIGMAPKVDRVLEMLLRQGGPVKKLVALVTELNDRITRQTLKLVEQQIASEGFGGAPAPFSWIALGSEGRREQTLHTDQDNALFYAEVSSADATELRAWFLRFSERVVDCLAHTGIPLCPGGVLACNPQWCRPEEQWRETFLRWITEPNPNSLLMAAIFFDFRPLYAGTDFPGVLDEELLPAIRQNRLFLRFMAKNALSNRPPLSLLKRFVVEKSGEHMNRFDLKMKGLTPIVDAARVLSLDLGIRHRNTFDRLDAIADRGVFDGAFHADLREAYEFIVYLQISRHLEALAKGEGPDNFVDPESLNNLQRKMLKESFAVVRRLQEIIEFRFRTRIVEI